jgi:GNAT superfamily N-acetyltransferase
MEETAPMDIWRAGPADAARIAGIVNAAYSKWVPLIGREPSPMLADYDKAVVEHRIDLIGENGTVFGLIETDVRPDHFWIENVAVAPDRQGRGIGTRLLAHADRLAREAGRTELRLLTNEKFTINIALYERQGYVITHRQPYHLGGVTAYLSKRLD